MSTAKDVVLAEVQSLAPELVRFRQDLHSHPEPAWMEFRTAAMVAAELFRLGLTVRMGNEAVHPGHMRGLPSTDEFALARKRAVAEGAAPELIERMGNGLTGIVADVDSPVPDAPLLALRFDMDANKIQEAQHDDHRPFREGFASVHAGCMHACGHDGHTALGLALATLCARLRHQLPVRVRFIFQPAEEGAMGAVAMLAAGAVEGVDALLGLHLGIQALDSHTLICGTHSMLASSKLNVFISGVPAHAAASPEQGKNALLAACATVQNLYAIPQHSAGITRLNVGKIEGGDSRNIIAPHCRFELETRGETTELDKYMREAAQRIIYAGAAMWGCTATIENAGHCDGGHSSPELATRIAAVAHKMPCYTTVHESGPFKASEDFASLLLAVQAGGRPAALIQAGVDRAASHHSSRFDFDEAGLVQAFELLARLIFEGRTIV